MRVQLPFKEEKPKKPKKLFGRVSVEAAQWNVRSRVRPALSAGPLNRCRDKGQKVSTFYLAYQLTKENFLKVCLHSILWQDLIIISVLLLRDQPNVPSNPLWGSRIQTWNVTVAVTPSPLLFRHLPDSSFSPLLFVPRVTSGSQLLTGF